MTSFPSAINARYEVGSESAGMVDVRDVLDDLALTGRFLPRTARVAAVLDFWTYAFHPLFQPIHRFLDMGTHYLALMPPLPEGTPLDELSANKVNGSQVAWIFRQLAACFAFLEEHELIHPRLDASAIYVDRDYGVTVTGQEAALPREAHTAAVLDARYAAPELLDHQTRTPRSGVYHLGALCHHFLTGRLPMRDQPFAGITQKLRRLKKSWDPLLERMLAAEPEQRPSWQAVQEQLADLEGSDFPVLVPPWLGPLDTAVVAKLEAELARVPRRSAVVALQTFPGRERSRRLGPFSSHAKEQGYLVLHCWQRQPETRRYKVINDLIFLLREGAARYLDGTEPADDLQPLSELYPPDQLIENWRRQMKRLTGLLVPGHYRGLVVMIEDVTNLGRDSLDVLAQLADWTAGTPLLLILTGAFFGHEAFRRLAQELPLKWHYLHPSPVPAGLPPEAGAPFDHAGAEPATGAEVEEILFWYRREGQVRHVDALQHFLDQSWHQLDPAEQLLMKLLSCSERPLGRDDIEGTFPVDRLPARMKFLMRAGLLVRSRDGAAAIGIPLIADFCRGKIHAHDLARIRQKLYAHEQSRADGGDPVQVMFLWSLQKNGGPPPAAAAQLEQAVFEAFEPCLLARLDRIHQRTDGSWFREYHLFTRVLRGESCEARSVSSFARLAELARAIRMRAKGDLRAVQKLCIAVAGRRHLPAGMRAYALVLAAEAAALLGEGAAVVRAWRRFLGYDAAIFAQATYDQWRARFAVAAATVDIRRELFDPAGLTPGLRGWVLANQAWFQRSFDAALEPVEEAFRDLTDLPDLYFRGRICKLAGNIRFRNNRPERAIEAYLAAQRCFTAIGDAAELAFVDFNLASAENLAGRFLNSRRRFEPIYRRAEAEGDGETRCQAGYHLMVCSLFLNEESRFMAEYRDHRRMAKGLPTREEEIRGLALKLHNAAASPTEEVAEEMVTLRALIDSVTVDPLLRDQAQIALCIGAFVQGRQLAVPGPYPTLTRWRHQLIDFLGGDQTTPFDTLMAQRGGGYFGACNLYLLKSLICAGFVPEKYLTAALADIFESHADQIRADFGAFLKKYFNKTAGLAEVPAAEWDRTLGLFERISWHDSDQDALRKRLLRAIHALWPYRRWGACSKGGSRNWQDLRLPEAAPLDADILAQLAYLDTGGGLLVRTFTPGGPGPPCALLLLTLRLQADADGVVWFLQDEAAGVQSPFYEPLLRFHGKLLEYALQGCAPAKRAPAPIGDREFGMVGASAHLDRVRGQIAKYGPSDLSIYISGESGTGKELAARAFHLASRRHGKPYRTINCSHYPDSLVEGELFGHKRGAFTGAMRDRAGVLEMVDGGTLFLDEIGDINAKVQSLLLRVIQEGEFSRIGEHQVRKVDIRFITATNKNIHDLIAAGVFRSDLYFRLVGEEVQLPPLRERFEDLPLLAAHFTRKYAPGRGVRYTRDFFDRLRGYHWPGNIRELENYIRKILINWSELDVFTAAECPPFLLPDGDTDERTTTLEVFEERNRLRFIRERLAQYGGNKTQAARSLGISRQQLTNLVTRYHLE